ncbi:MAG: hypothetical protein A2252_06355 [Elusimicrobia bacterium RIFOXYA2_FULL_39_19]|nr:MAG: hypothetical protein A2252_06355 [Elusimicrobia bacterium RIFOXYA2_FULL_39_19]
MNKLISVIEITASSIRFAQAEITAEKPVITNPEELPFNSRETLIIELKKLTVKHKISSSYLITALPRAQVFLKKITIPPANVQEAKNIIQYEAERYLPFSVDTAVIDFYPLNPLSETSPNEILLIAVKKETLDKYLENFSTAGLCPDNITVSSFAAINLLATVSKETQSFAFLDFNDSFWEIGIFSDNVLAISRGFSLPPAESMPDLIINEITNTLNMLAKPANEKIEKIYYFHSKDNDKIIEKIKNNLPISVTGLNSAMLTGFLLPSACSINLLPDSIKENILRKRNKTLYSKIIKTTLIAFAAFLAAFFIFTYFKSSSNREIIKNIESNKKEIIELARIDSKLETINNYKNNNNLPLEILNEISKTLPGNVYIRQFNYDYTQNTVTIRGRASSYDTASKTAGAFGKSRYFAQVTNKGSYTARVGDKDLVDFELQLQLKLK